MEFNDEYFMKKALFYANKAYLEGEVPVGAIIVIENKIIARAYNQIEKLNDVTAHAEMLALTSASNFTNSKYLNQCSIYSTLEPCYMCAGALLLSKIGAIIYSTSDPENGGFSNGIELSKNTTIRKGILLDESKALIKKFFKGKRI